MSTAARFVTIGLVLLLGVIAAVVLVTRLNIPAPATGESPRPSTAGSAGRSAAPSAPGAEDAEAAFGEIEVEVRELRGLPAPDIGPADIIDRAQLGVELEEMLAEEWTDDELARANLTLQAMGLLTPDQDLRELSQALLSDQVIGFYDPLEKRMVVVSDEGLSALARITYAHEYTHALQDEAFGSFAARDELTDDDAILARQALEEGDATVVMFQWALQPGNLTPGELQEVGTTPVPDTSDVPGWMLRQLEFPYRAGFAFVTQLRGTGDWAAVNDAYTHAPASTEQVLHPEKYLAGEQPADVEAAPLAGTLGGRWEDLEPTTMGEIMIDIWLVELGADQATATGAAAGWGGDRLAVARGPGGEWAMAWRVTWDSAADADEFQAAHQGLQPGGDISAALVRTAPKETLILHAPTDGLLAGLVAAFGE